MTPRPPQRSIAGPVVLILLGVLFLLGTMGILQWHGLGTLFARFWPALLILWGVLKLIEYEQAKRLGQPARGIGVGGVFLMLFLIMAGLIATQAARVNWKSIGEHIQLGDDQGLDEIFGGSTFDYSDELSQEIPAGSSLHVNDDRGTITINVADFKTNDKTNDKTMKVSVRKKVRAEKEQDAENYNSKTKPQITVADKVITLNANTQGAGDKGVTTDMDIYVPLNTALVITSNRGDVTIAGMSSNVEVNHHRGEVNINDHTGNVSLNLDSCDRLADSLAGPMRLTTRSKDIALEGLSGDLRLEDSNGTVEVGLHNPGNIQIDNRKGDVRVSIPPNTPIKVEARTRQGEIESDFDEIKVDNRDRQSSASGSIGTNGPRLVMNCEKGTIEIRKGTVAVVPPAPPTPPATPGKPGKPAKALPAPKAAPVESEN